MEMIVNNGEVEFPLGQRSLVWGFHHFFPVQYLPLQEFIRCLKVSKHLSLFITPPTSCW